MSDIVQKVTLNRAKKVKLPSFTPGDTVAVSVRVKEGNKERIQVFKGVVIKLQGSGMSRAFTVRKISEGVGVERTFPVHSPFVEKVKLVSRGKVRRAKLYYLRSLRGRAARLESELHFEGRKSGDDQKKAEATEATASEK